ncbi:MAG: Gfo/Idh/MocA family oxidoreductase [Lentisphaerae bacterium]|jgi:predicted dehydrogenase|nr:Gfo/Idh/MocA family oxidoreductase [Lentisphaerota bacterium]MBT4816569.1 Gfo/Idh/MocA family oxidoreductase [Lentisphaerota bacterium]MBT5607142.1 Gfo/Idh/MocA family oxidoreductase [Lentisphaerota bacterium]MBT7053544.1 Gfo/Idh/MocA family oxidoreductase [Lentisphaerota bacterium]MBT7842700.1 Gfo/Idh/MocA family oxidoreductase [Lentisphaerota bacterium]
MGIRAAVIGCGNISQFHFSGLEKAGVEVTWVCDLHEEAARPWAEKLSARYTADYREAIADPDVDVITVTPVSAVHKPICLAAIAAGKAVICEKTLAMNADDALEIVQAAEKAGTIFYTSYMKRFIPAVEQAKALLPSLGRIVSTHIRAYQCWGDRWAGNPDEGFFHTPPGGTSDLVRNYGGGILVCGGSHILDLVCFLLGRPNRLYASVHNPPGCDYDVQAAALLETNNGVVHYEALAHPLSTIGFLRDGWDERIEINGLNGRLEIYSSAWDQVTSKASLLVHTDNATGQATEYRYAPASPFDRAVAFFCANVARGEQGTQSRLTGYDVDELIDHIKRSAGTGQAVTINWQV